MNAAKEAAMAVDDRVQQLSSSAEGMQAELEEQIVENVANNESVFAEPAVEEIIEQVQQTSEFPFFLMASTLILGLVIFVAIFLRRRRAAKSEVAPVATETLVAAETEVAEAKCEVEAAPAAVEVAETEVAAAPAAASVEPEAEAVVVAEPEAVVEAEVAVETAEEVEAVTTTIVSAEEPEIQVAAAAAPLAEMEVSSDSIVAPKADVVPSETEI